MRIPLLVAMLWVSFISEGKAFTSQVIPYYGEHFYRALETGTQNEELKDILEKVLSGAHLKVGNYDQIMDSCGLHDCYEHVSVGYDMARKLLMGTFYLVETDDGYGVKDLYCDSVKSTDDFRGGASPGPGKIPNANILNIEHTWPQSKFSSRFNKGMQKSDMHHLFPTDSKLNSTRGNHNFGDVVRDTQNFHCPTTARFGKGERSNKDLFEPPDNHKGNVARALFYFSTRYKISISDDEEASLRQWSKEDPIDQEEIDRNQFIYQHQGNRNPFIDFPNLEDTIADF